MPDNCSTLSVPSTSRSGSPSAPASISAFRRARPSAFFSRNSAIPALWLVQQAQCPRDPARGRRHPLRRRSNFFQLDCHRSLGRPTGQPFAWSKSGKFCSSTARLLPQIKKWAVSPLISPPAGEFTATQADKFVCILSIRRNARKFNAQVRRRGDFHSVRRLQSTHSCLNQRAHAAHQMRRTSNWSSWGPTEDGNVWSTA